MFDPPVFRNKRVAVFWAGHDASKIFGLFTHCTVEAKFVVPFFLLVVLFFLLLCGILWDLVASIV